MTTALPEPDGDRALVVADLHMSYGTKRAVDGVSFDVRNGEIFGLLGPNGAGKTTTLSAIEGLLLPDAGSIQVDGIDIRHDRRRAKSKLGVQLQSTSFQSELTITEIVRLYGGLYGVRMSDRDVEEMMEGAQLRDEMKRRFGQLSGGQQQRVSLLIATLNSPALLLLDEPTSGLDPQARRQLWGRIERSRDDGRSVLLTTHSMEEAQAVCDRVAIIDHGKILTIDSPKGLVDRHKDDPDVRAVARGDVTLEDVFIGLTGTDIR